MATKPCESCGAQVDQRYVSKAKPGAWVCIACRDSEVEPNVDEILDKIIITTSHSIEGKRIVKYLGIVASQSIQGLGMFKDFGAGFADAFGGAASGYEKSLESMTEAVLKKLKVKAIALGANAVIAIDLELGELKGSMIMVAANGTAVLTEEIVRAE